MELFPHAWFKKWKIIHEKYTDDDWGTIYPIYPIYIPIQPFCFWPTCRTERLDRAMRRLLLLARGALDVNAAGVLGSGVEPRGTSGNLLELGDGGDPAWVNILDMDDDWG